MGKTAAKRKGAGGYAARLLNAEKERFWELDFLRGFCVVLMVFDHFMFSVAYLLPELNDFFGGNFWQSGAAFAYAYWDGALRAAVRPLVIACFLVLCGAGCTFSRDNFGRSAKMLAVALGISAVTAGLERYYEETFILFGVVHMLGVSAFVYALLSLAGDAVAARAGGKRAMWCARLFPGLVGVALLALYFALWGDLSREGWAISLVSTVKTDAASFILPGALLEFYNVYYPSADYFPLLPYGAIVLTGSLFGWLVYHTSARHAFRRLDGKWNAGLCFVGRHALAFYVGHQVVVFLLLLACAGLSAVF